MPRQHQLLLPEELARWLPHLMAITLPLFPLLLAYGACQAGSEVVIQWQAGSDTPALCCTSGSELTLVSDGSNFAGNPQIQMLPHDLRESRSSANLQKADRCGCTASKSPSRLSISSVLPACPLSQMPFIEVILSLWLCEENLELLRFST